MSWSQAIWFIVYYDANLWLYDIDTDDSGKYGVIPDVFFIKRWNAINVNTISVKFI